MQNLFYRKAIGARLPLLALWMLALTVTLVTPSAFAAPDPDMALPPVSASSSLQNVAMVIPYDLGRMPAPPRKPSTRESGEIARTAWDGGLKAYRQGDYSRAFQLFARAETATKNKAWEHAAAAFWAARAAERLNDQETANGYRAIAARHDRTFYGQLAQAQLGVATRLLWDAPQADLAAMNRLQAHPAGRQAVAHVNAGRLSAADQVLQGMIKGSDAGLRAAALTFALHHGLPATALKLAASVENDTGVRYDAAYYPVGGWIEDHAFRVDRALVHAIIRQESSFNPRARSHMGAVGLMQLLPSTANYMVKVGGRARAYDLTQSTHNLEVGQQYLEHLLDRPMVQGDIMKMLVAYNAGPGNLAKWQRDLNDVTDPLLFIEVIPSAETRAYVEKVMSAYWIYRDRFGMGNPTLSLVAKGQNAPLMARTPWFAGLNVEIGRYVGM